MPDPILCWRCGQPSEGEALCNSCRNITLDKIQQGSYNAIKYGRRKRKWVQAREAERAA
jgi:hypothetical protein